MNLGRNSRLRTALVTTGLLSTALLAGSCPARSQMQSTSGPANGASTSNVQHSSPPKVVYEHGDLTVTAENSPLSEVMSAVHQATGAEVDLPAGMSGERIWAKVGPGPARKVLADLLSNTDLNYIIQGSAQEPGGVESVTLSLRDNSPGSGPAVASAGKAGYGAAEIPDRETPEPKESAASGGPAAPAASSNTASKELPEAPSLSSNATSTSVLSESGQASIARPTTMPVPLPNSFSTDSMVQQLANMYQQRQQMQQPAQSGAARN